MLFSSAAGGAAALPAPGGGGGMAAGLMEFIDLDSVIVADSGNPIADLAGLGHGLMNAALAAMTALMGAAAGSGLLESVPFVGKGLDMFESVWQVADGFVSTVLGLLLIAGAVLASRNLADPNPFVIRKQHATEGYEKRLWPELPLFKRKEIS